MLTADRVSHFDRPESELRAALDGDLRCDLSHWGLIAAADPTTRFSARATHLRCSTSHVGRSLIGAYCSPKGPGAGQLSSCFGAAMIFIWNCPGIVGIHFGAFA